MLNNANNIVAISILVNYDNSYPTAVYLISWGNNKKIRIRPASRINDCIIVLALDMG